jgi:uncharacterized protein YbjT (DUF2867 family)
MPSEIAGRRAHDCQSDNGVGGREIVIVITTPTGQIGGQVLDRLLEGEDPIRVIVRDPSRLDIRIRDRVEVIQGSHDHPAVLDRALDGADGLFWLVPPNLHGPRAEEHYQAFARPAADAIRRHKVAHVVGVSSAGHGWPARAGILSAAFAMDAEIERTGVAYRALSMPFYMENLLRQLGAIREQGAFFLAYSPDRPLASVATRDIAAAAAALLADRSWTGQENVPVFGPDRLSPSAMAEVISDVLGRPVAYRQVSLADFGSTLSQRGASEDLMHAVAVAPTSALLSNEIAVAVLAVQPVAGVIYD